MKIAIAGTGYVGLVTGVCLAEVGNENIVCVDVDENKIENMKKGHSPIYEKDLEKLMVKNYKAGRIDYTTDYKSAYEDANLIIIAVGTPERSDGSPNLDYIKTVAKQIAETVENDVLVVIKSTVPMGTNEEIEVYIKKNLKNKNIKVELASNPEFLSQGTAVRDMLHGSRIVLGVESDWARETLESIYKKFDQPIIVTNRNSAEMIKYASNDFLALKISFMNDIANLCEVVGANVEDVALGMSYDDRIGSKFLKAGIGYGGSCFPKDTKALHWLAEHNGHELKTVKAAIEVNESQKLKLVKKACKLVESFKGIKVAVLGLTYKPDTDDVREAPSIVNIQYLLEREADVTAFDTVGIENAKKIFGDSINYSTSIDEAIKDAEICFIMTEWKEVVNYDINKYKELMKRPLVLDGRNCYNQEDMKNAGIEYYSIGR
ncbi:MAG: UDP-glucose/GDP-mannose dehydrogenase family protein [Clostridioides difficile]|nr:UDP-glucose/GDP-mannose dehydrogenase family protein [Clostridioides sp.]MBS5788573.1 UDP-glucose/GDP-mannose dehydrogenase family protein [Clostridioides difficile]